MSQKPFGRHINSSSHAVTSSPLVPRKTRTSPIPDFASPDSSTFSLGLLRDKIRDRPRNSSKKLSASKVSPIPRLDAAVKSHTPGLGVGLISQLNNEARRRQHVSSKGSNYNRQPDSIAEDILSSTDRDEESAIFNEKPHHKHNDSSVSSQRMRHINTVEVPAASMIDLEAIRLKNANRSRPSRAFISKMASHQAIKKSQSQELEKLCGTQRPRISNSNSATLDLYQPENEEDWDEAVVSLQRERDRTSERFVLRRFEPHGIMQGLPLNHLPKLQTYLQKSDLTMAELEGDPQKPSGTIPQRSRFNGTIPHAKIEDSGAKQSKVLLSSHQAHAHDFSSVEEHESEITLTTESRHAQCHASNPIIRPHNIRHQHHRQKQQLNVPSLTEKIEYTDQISLADLESDSQRQTTQVHADENVSDTTPHKQSKTQLSASENVSQSQYLSSSFQNTKRDSKLKQILQMSMSSSYGSGSKNGGRQNKTMRRKLEQEKPNSTPQLISSANKEVRVTGERANFRFQQNQATIMSTPARINKIMSPSKLSRVSQPQVRQEGARQEFSQRMNIMQSKWNSSNEIDNTRENFSASAVNTNSVGKQRPTMIATKAYPKNHRLPLGKTTPQEPMKMIYAGSNSSSSAQKVKATSKFKRADFGSGMQPNKPIVMSSGLATGTAGSSVLDDDVGVASNGEATGQSVNDHGNSKSMDQIEVYETRVPRPYFGQAALQRGLSPPAHVKELSSDSRSSANIVEHNSPLNGGLTQKNLQSSRHQLIKYNRSAYKLKQYISDVNKINMRQSQLSSGGQQFKINVVGEGKLVPFQKESAEAILDNQKQQSEQYVSKPAILKKNHNQSQLTTQNTSSANVGHRASLKQRSVSPGNEGNSLSRLLSYCPTSHNRLGRQTLASLSAHAQQQPASLKSRVNNLFASKASPGHPQYGSGGSQKKNQRMIGGSRILTANRMTKKVSALQCLAVPRIFRTLLSFLDYMALFTFMQTRRDYRWDISTRSKGYQPDYFWVHKEIRKRMKQVLLTDGGLRSTVERRNFWVYRSKLTRVRKEYEDDLYTTLVHQSEVASGPEVAERPSMTEIGKDVGRTFPDLQFFQKHQPGQAMLHRILSALSIFKPQGETEPLGYTQGMNFIAGTVLVHLQQHEENTFWFLVSLLCEHKFRHVFNFLHEGTFRVLCYQLEVLTQVYIPELHSHFTRLKIPTDIYASNWFITMFTNDLPFDMAPSVLDVYLLEGHKGLLRIALSILTFLQTELLQLQFDELMVFLSHPHAREQLFRSLDQYWLFQTSYTFKISNNLLRQLEKLYIVQEKLEQLRPKLIEQKKDIQPESTDGMIVSDLLDFCSLLYFRKLTVNQTSLRQRHEWHILMLMPDDVDELLAQGISTDEIEDLRLFYNIRIKERSLDSMLSSVELLIKDYLSLDVQLTEDDVLHTTERHQMQYINSTSQDIAQESYLRATNKMQVNSIQVNYKLVDRRSGVEPNPFATTDKEPLRLEQSSSSMLPNKQKSNHLLSKKPTQLEVPEVLSDIINEDILSSLFSPRSQKKSSCERRSTRRLSKYNAGNSQASTPKMKGGLRLALPVRARNYNDSEPYGQPNVIRKATTVSQLQKPSIFANLAIDLGSKLENLFKPLGLSPQNARVQPGSHFSQSMYDSAKDVMHVQPPRPQQMVQPDQHSLDSQGSNLRVYHHAKSRRPYTQTRLQIQPSELQTAMKITKVNNDQLQRRTLMPHTMLNGDEQVQVIRGSSTSFEVLSEPHDSEIPLREITRPQQSAIANESQRVYFAQNSSNHRPMARLPKPPRSISLSHPSQNPEAAVSMSVSRQSSASRPPSAGSRSQERRANSMLQKALSPRVKYAKQPSRLQTSIPQSSREQQIHKIPESIVERKSIHNLNESSEKQLHESSGMPFAPRVTQVAQAPQNVLRNEDSGLYFGLSRLLL